MVPPLRMHGGTLRDTVTRQQAHEPFGWRPTTLLVTVRHRGRTGVELLTDRQHQRLKPGKSFDEIWEACRIGAVVFVAGVRPSQGAARPTSRKETP